MNGLYLQKLAFAGMAGNAIGCLALTILGLARFYLLHDERANALVLLFGPLFLISLVAAFVMNYIMVTQGKAE